MSHMRISLVKIDVPNKLRNPGHLFIRMCFFLDLSQENGLPQLTGGPINSDFNSR